ESPLKFDDIISPICLPSADQQIDDDLKVVATGFGFGGPNSTRDNYRLRETSMPVHEEKWRNALQLRGVICAGSSDHKVQHGDSGGPLAMKATDGRWFQIGITSFGLNGHWVAPKTFTDVRKYCGWIKETTRGDVSCQEEVAVETIQ
ncbi:hypothetical protein PENTCL1PPCAC_29905, partial [Pristionchus entomophagus]